MKVFLVVGYSTVYLDPSFEYEFKTLEEAKQKACEILTLTEQTREQASLRIYEAEQVCKGRHGRGDGSFVFESVK